MIDEILSGNGSSTATALGLGDYLVSTEGQGINWDAKIALEQMLDSGTWETVVSQYAGAGLRVILTVVDTTVQYRLTLSNHKEGSIRVYLNAG